MDGSKRSFENLIHTLDNYSRISGLKLNESKCYALRIGKTKDTNVHFLEDKHFTWTSEKAKALGITFHTDKSQFITENLSKKIDDFKSTLKRWQHRKLTLMGKITVIKSFALPKLLYPLGLLPNPTHDTKNLINNAMFDFLWNSKPDKISRTQIKKQLSEGGLKMIDLDSFINALKGSWVKRLFDEENKGQWKLLYLKMINKFGGKLLFECNLNEQLITQMFGQNKFLKDIIIAWACINKDAKTGNISTEIIWNNKNILINMHTLFKKEWFEKGIKHISDIFDFRSKRFHTFQELVELYNVPINQQFFYNQLRTSIPQQWKNKIKLESIHEALQTRDNTFSRAIQNKQTNRFLYNLQMKQNKNEITKPIVKWEHDLNNPNIIWKRVFINIYSSTIDTILREFQYKYIMRIIPTNKTLMKYKIKSSNLCEFCNMHTETIRHLFWECNHIQHFWNNLSNWLNSINLNMVLNFEIISLGILENPRIIKNKTKNFILILAKQFIFKHKH